MLQKKRLKINKGASFQNTHKSLFKLDDLTVVVQGVMLGSVRQTGTHTQTHAHTDISSKVNDNITEK